MTTSPISFYKDLIARQSKEISQLNSKSRFYITGKLIAFCLLVLSVYQTWHTQSVWLIIPCLITAGCYIFLLLADSKCQSTLSRLGKLHTVCANEIKYLKGDYSPFNDGKAYINPHHEYSYDLDIFGPRSLFQRINRTITEEGSKHLAYMLTHPEHNPQHITDRQDAVREISTLTQWRLKFQSLPYTNNHIKTIAEAIERQHLQYPLRRYQILSYLSVTCTIVSLLTALSGFAPWIVFGVLFLTQMAISFLRAKHTVINTQHTGKLHQEYKNYIEILKLAEQAQFRSALLKTAQKELLYSEKSCLKSFSQLSKILNLQDQRYSGIVYILLNGLFLYDIILNNMFEKWARTYMPLVGHWLKAIAQIDAIACLGTYAFNHPQNTYAECLTEDSEFIIEATDLYHPFITSEKAITNNFSLTRHHCILITGANMSGKSTFLRAIGVNYLLANIGAPVCAKTFKYTIVSLFSSMRTTDNLSSDISYFQAELLRLKQLLLFTRKQAFTLVILDEMLKGTNSKDKLHGSAMVLQEFKKLRISSVVATHDLELARLEEEDPHHFTNYCFEIELADDIHYSYKIKKGVAGNLNASFLLSKILRETSDTENTCR